MKLIYLEWEDAIADSSWHTEVEAKKFCADKNTIIKQVGWLYEENKRYIVLISRLSYWDNKSSDPSYGNLQKIPKTWIKKRKTITL